MQHYHDQIEAEMRRRTTPPALVDAQGKPLRSVEWKLRDAMMSGSVMMGSTTYVGSAMHGDASIVMRHLVDSLRTCGLVMPSGPSSNPAASALGGVIAAQMPPSHVCERSAALKRKAMRRPAQGLTRPYHCTKPADLHPGYRSLAVA